MDDLEPPFFAARPDEAKPLAQLANMAAEGLSLYLWEQMAEPGETGWEVGERRVRREEGAFSYRNVVTLRDGDAPGGAILACLVGYAVPDEPDPVDDDVPAMFRPLQELENRAAGTWYVNILATFPEHRGRGLGARLLGFAEAKARAAGLRGLSIIVEDTNAGARRLYERTGCREVARRPMVKEGWDNPGSEWILLVKAF